MFIFKLGELTACLHADGSDSVRGAWEGRIAGVICSSSNSTGIIEFFTFGLIITKHGIIVFFTQNIPVDKEMLLFSLFD